MIETPSSVSSDPVRLTRGPDKVVAGVADGMARYLGVDPVIVRIAFVVVTMVSGMGIPVYIAGWLLMPEPVRDGADRDAYGDGAGDGAQQRGAATLLGAGRVGGGATANRRMLHLALQGRSAQQAVAVGMVVVGGILLLGNLGLLFSGALVWPVTLAGVGAGVLWARTGQEDRARLTRFAGQASAARLVVGTLLVVAGIAVYLPFNRAATGQVLLAVVVTLAGLAVLLGPWVWRLASELSAERRERIRSEERAEMAAHLHDSVLQTLALIQRNAERPRELVALARHQERELRAWLYGDPRRGQDPTTLSGALEALGEEVEVLHDVAVDVVTVGDCPLDDGLRALVRASREAVVNAAKHSGAPSVSVYGEVEADRALVFVRDRGKGFDPATVAGDRLGITNSIHERLARRRGRASITSAPGEGTEVALEVPRRATPA